MNRTFVIHWQDGKVSRLEGKTLAEAFVLNNLIPALMGSIDYYYKAPIPVKEKPKEGRLFQIYLMETKKDQWEEFMKPSTNFVALEKMMQMKVKRDGVFSGMVLDLNTENPVSWIWR